jgi:DNA polymerase III delta prime subunit
MAIRPRFQINASSDLINHAKAIAYSRGLSLTEYALQAMAKDGDEKMKKLVEKELGSRSRPGNPAKPKA